MEIIGIELLNVDELENVLRDEDEVIFVDSQKGNSNIIDVTGDEIIVWTIIPVMICSNTVSRISARRSEHAQP